MSEVHGIVYAYHSSPRLGDLTRYRTNASLPFCGRYRLIDFALSSLSNAGVHSVGVIMQRDYQSLLDHLGSGKAWDLSRRSGGLHLLRRQREQLSLRVRFLIEEYDIAARHQLLHLVAAWAEAGGVLTLFTGLALVLGLADLMWGQLYQNQSILLVMLLIVFLMGLSMLGVFTLPVIDLKTGENTKNPRLQSYLTGLVSTFLATPCSGPLLGGVLGWAFTQPLLILMVVFWAVGVGMALPYLLFCIWPNMARILPRPGPWMHVFERVVGFFLLGTALYLLSILPVEKHMHVLSVLLLVSLCAWLWGQFCGVSAPPLRRRVAGIAGGLLLLAAIVWVLRPVAPLPQWREFSPEYFTAQMGKKPMLLEFTADWCPNCKFMEATVLTDERLRAWQARYGMELIRVDLTNANAYAVRLLEALGSKSIPLTALFPEGDGASSPLVLRDVYGVQSLEKAMSETFTGG